MEENILAKKLENVEREIHLIAEAFKKRQKLTGTEISKEPEEKSITLLELNEIMEKDRIVDTDSTKLIKKMRKKMYDL